MTRVKYGNKVRRTRVNIPRVAHGRLLIPLLIRLILLLTNRFPTLQKVIKHAMLGRFIFWIRINKHAKDGKGFGRFFLMDHVQFGLVILSVDGMFRPGMNVILQRIKPIFITGNLHAAHGARFAGRRMDNGTIEDNAKLQLVPTTRAALKLITLQVGIAFVALLGGNDNGRLTIAIGVTTATALIARGGDNGGKDNIPPL